MSPRRKTAPPTQKHSRSSSSGRKELIAKEDEKQSVKKRISLNWSYRYKWEEGTYTAPTPSDCADKNNIPLLRAGDEHTFKCFVPQFDPPDFMTGGHIKIRVDYRYLRFLQLSKTACFDYEPTRDWRPRWIRRGCP